YEGTVLYVSHDRYFINRTAHRIMDLTAQTFVNYLGNYDYYLEKKDDLMKTLELNVSGSSESPSAKADVSDTKLDWKAQKEEQARIRKRENALKKCEEEIAELENRLSEIDAEMSDPAVGTQVLKLQELNQEQTEVRSRLDILYEEWEKLAE
ncbi:MAG: ABC transporter ATP-binding protein, partial [Acetatifactor sp.]|nr:ABC transporter ATP-binding protein [Acetatifactor sp.]